MQEIEIRPQRLSELLGQDMLRKNLGTYINAALGRGDALDHTLFYGPPGLGKTTLAGIIANEMGGTIHATSAPIMRKVGDLAQILLKLRDGDVLFIDEIHRLPTIVEEVLYPAMEDFHVDAIMANGQTLHIPLCPFTLVGATTMSGSISKPMMDRFGIKMHLELYNKDQLVSIVARTAEVLGLMISGEAAVAIARRARGTPRIANALLRRLRDFSTSGVIDNACAQGAFRQMGVDSLGLEEQDRKLLELIMTKFHGGPVGLSTIATSLHEDQTVVAEVYEPYMVRCGLIDRTSQGRKTTSAAREHLAMWKKEQKEDQ